MSGELSPDLCFWKPPSPCLWGSPHTHTFRLPTPSLRGNLPVQAFALPGGVDISISPIVGGEPGPRQTCVLTFTLGSKCPNEDLEEGRAILSEFPQPRFHILGPQSGVKGSFFKGCSLTWSLCCGAASISKTSPANRVSHSWNLQESPW